MIPSLARPKTNAHDATRIHLDLTTPEAEQLYALINFVYDLQNNPSHRAAPDAPTECPLDFTTGTPLAGAASKLYKGLRSLTPSAL